MTSLIQTLDRRWYPEFVDEWDGVAFRNRVLEVLGRDDRLLDIGAGRGATSIMNFKGLAAEVVGTDINSAVLGNPFLNQAIHTPDGDLSALKSASFDLIICKDVMEHVADPDRFLSEVSRLLKPGARFLAKTPGGLHYVTVIARITPLWFHKMFNKMRGREQVDTFPTVYKLNSRRDLKRYAARAGLRLVKVEMQEGRPEYLRFSPVTYFIGRMYERLVNGLKLSAFKAVLYVEMEKPQANT